MARLGIDKEFLLGFAALEKQVQNRVLDVFARFEQATHTGLHLEKIGNARDDRFRSIRIDKFWRGIVLAPDSGDTYTLLKVLPHDDAYAWAQRRRASVNAATGRIEIRDVVAIDATLPELARQAERAVSRLFAHVADKDLRRLGIDEQTLAFARVLTDVRQLEMARGFLPPNQWDALFGLAAGMTPEEVWAEIGAASETARASFDADDVGAAVERSGDRVVLVDGPEELLEVFRHPFALWRVYLHPAQRRIAQARFGGPARVTGGPGTGKTVVALHRAHELALRGAGRVLVTTFTSTMGDSLAADLDLLVHEPLVRERITVATVNKLAYDLFRARYPQPAILTDVEERAVWRTAARGLGLSFSESFLSEEWRQVILAQEITTEAEYQKARRVGRGRPLGPRQRAQVWAAWQHFDRDLRASGRWTHEMICVEAARLLEQRPQRPYRHVVIDEAQDLSPVQWRFLRAAVAPGADDIFVAGDAHQRIYHNRVSLRELGIPVVGRSARLTVNYRTTAEILAWSLGMLRGEPIDDMDGGLDSVAGYRSEIHGPAPRLRGFATWNDEIREAAEQIRAWTRAGVALDEIGVAVRSNKLAESFPSALHRLGIPTRLLARSSEKAAQTEQAVGPAVVVGTMHRMKGLEFRCLAVLGVGERQVPASSAVTPVGEDEIAHAQDVQRERCLLFVACTRAREELSVSWHGPQSPFLAPFDPAIRPV
ncbi:AAA family ATPase [Frankia sp. Mgl5]|uniref:UvrD-helicase domain-containing protein n=1 Tax=Frankia sp. Mgl5 TaxID=2933793 RepID=UPI00200FDC62|nr:UvrD-helicase domain-containing protein [Frankia sp. Mgl5]MCK9925869.1 AAA family ATPase [Frankia sp. Mgl5]